jgi:hypothetical protein
MTSFLEANPRENSFHEPVKEAMSGDLNHLEKSTATDESSVSDARTPLSH